MTFICRDKCRLSLHVYLHDDTFITTNIKVQGVSRLMTDRVKYLIFDLHCMPCKLHLKN